MGSTPMTTVTPPPQKAAATTSAALTATAIEILSEFTTRLDKEGLAVVPRHPTQRMIEAGRLAGNGDPAMATAIFTAMMEAVE